jgi:hypothetical protein
MAQKRTEDSFSEQETARRLDAILQGAFAGPPTPLKDIPKQNAEMSGVFAHFAPN